MSQQRFVYVPVEQRYPQMYQNGMPVNNGQQQGQRGGGGGGGGAIAAVAGPVTAAGTRYLVNQGIQYLAGTGATSAAASGAGAAAGGFSATGGAAAADAFMQSANLGGSLVGTGASTGASALGATSGAAATGAATAAGTGAAAGTSAAAAGTASSGAMAAGTQAGTQAAATSGIGLAGAAALAGGALGVYGMYDLMSSDGPRGGYGRAAAQGAASGAAIGSVIPGIGTIAGALIGGAAGAIKAGTGSRKDGLQMFRDDLRTRLQNSGYLDENYMAFGVNAGKDGGFQFDDGRRIYEYYKGQEDGEGPTDEQGQLIGKVNPIGYLLTGGNDKNAVGYTGAMVANTLQESEGGVTDDKIREAYKKAGFDYHSAHNTLGALAHEGRITVEEAQAGQNALNNLWADEYKKNPPKYVAPTTPPVGAGATPTPEQSQFVQAPQGGVGTEMPSWQSGQNVPANKPVAGTGSNSGFFWQGGNIPTNRPVAGGAGVGSNPSFYFSPEWQGQVPSQMNEGFVAPTQYGPRQYAYGGR